MELLSNLDECPTQRPQDEPRGEDRVGIRVTAAAAEDEVGGGEVVVEAAAAAAILIK